MKSYFKRSISLLMAFVLMLPILPGPVLQWTGVGTSVQAEDNIVYYKDITFGSGFATHPMKNVVNLNFPSMKVTNLSYNTTTKQLSYTIAPEAILHVNVDNSQKVPSGSVWSQRVMVTMCGSGYTQAGYDYELSMNNGRDENWFCTADFYQQTASSYYANWSTDWGTLYTLYLPKQTYQNLDFDLSTIRERMKTTYPNNYTMGYNFFPPDSWGHDSSGDPEFFRLRIIVDSDWKRYDLGEDPYGYGYDPGGYTPYMTPLARLIPNHPPTISVGTPNGITLVNAPGLSGINIEGFVSDPDNEDVTVAAEIPGMFYKRTVVSQAQSSKPFSIPIDAIEDSLAPGTYNMAITASDPSGMTATANLTLNVKQQLKNKSFILINTPVEFGTKFYDSEGDSKYGERFKYDHDPYFYDNFMGILGDSGLWRSSAITSFSYSGVYTATFQGRDNPKNDDRFDNYRKWSRDNLSSMTFHVHRKPIALFAAKLAGGTLQLTDNSYDLDHITASNKGLVEWQWQYKKSEAKVWIDGSPPSQLPSTDQHDIRLRVRDMDGENGVGVWSDWCIRTVGAASNLPPVALFTVDPKIVSHRKATTITDKSFDPDNDPLDIYSWSVVKDGWNTVWSHWGGASTPPNIAAFGTGNYQINLQVRDNRGLWSETYSQSVTVMNHPPAAAFYMPPEVYRDTVITMDNQTPDPDEDGDNLSYSWNARINNSPYYYAGSNRNQVMTIGDLITRNGISPRQSISEGWEMRLTASDGPLSSNATRLFTVKNHVPTAAIHGPDSVFQYDTRQYTSSDEDHDPSDIGSLQYYWKVTGSDGVTTLYRTPNIEIGFPEPGVYTLEHWAVDQIGDKSSVASLKVNVAQNLAPSMMLTSPNGTLGNPSVIDAEQQGDPLIEWMYTDPENDPQEKYRLEFFTKDSLLAKSVENPDGTGLLRQYQVPNLTFERFEIFSVYGRVYSKSSWSDISNEKAFIIDNPPVPGFTMVTDTGKNATAGPIYRTDILQVTSTAHDEDEPKGDSLTYRYMLQPSGGTEGLISTASGFDKSFTTNGTFIIRQTVTDSLGLSREVSRALTVVNRLPVVNLTFPTSDTLSKPTIASTLTPTIKWSYSDEDGDEQQRFQVHIRDAATNSIVAQSPIMQSSSKQWTVPANVLTENQKYTVQVTVYDGNESEGFGRATSPRKYLMVNLLSVKGGVKHTAEWNANRQSYNLKQSGDPESPRAYNVFWAGEKFVLQADATGLPDTIQVTMDGGYTTQLAPVDEDKKLWEGELYDSSFEKLPNGPVTFTFTAQNEYNTKTDKATVIISENWSQYYQSHRIK